MKTKFLKKITLTFMISALTLTSIAASAKEKTLSQSQTTGSAVTVDSSKTTKTAISAAYGMTSADYYSGWSYLNSSAGGPYPTVSQGSSDSATIRKLQDMLRHDGHTEVAVDGAFGPITLAAVKSIQGATSSPYRSLSYQPLTTDGIVGPYTWGKIFYYGVPLD